MLVLICLLLMPSVALAEQVPDHGIPVLAISLDGGDGEFQKMNTSEGHAYECAGSMSLDVPDGYADATGLTAPQDRADLKIEYMRGRGNSTWNPDGGRNPYKVKLSKKTDLLGPDVGANKHWVLLASPYDSSSLRNRLVAFMGSRLGLAYTPVGVHVDLVINGEYRGSYYLAEQVRIGDARVAIDELGPADVEEPEVTGGYLLAMAPDADEPVGNRITTSRGIRFCGDSPVFDAADPDEELGAPEQKAYLANYLQETEDAVWNRGPWTDYMDPASASAYWWVQEFTKNVDAFLTPSTYLYKERGGKLFWGPLWDFDQSMGSISGDAIGFTSREMDWLDFLRTYDEGFIAQLRSDWLVYDAALEDIVRAGGVLDQLANEVRSSWQADFDLWVRDTPVGPYSKSFDEEVSSLRSWIAERRAWINAHIDTELTDVYRKVTFMADGQEMATRYARRDSFLYNLVIPPKKDGLVFLGWQDQDGNFVEGGVEVQDDVVLTAQYAPASEIVLAQDIFFNSYDFWTSLDDANGPSYVILAADTQERYPDWSSSDPSVAEVNTYGAVVAHAVGTTTITATLASGASKSFLLHVTQSFNELSTNVDSMTPQQDTLELEVGAYGQVRVDIRPQANNLTLPAYESANPSVAEVDEMGVVRGIAPGTTEIRLYDPTDSEKTYATYTVVVSDNADNESEDPEEEPGDDEGPDGEEPEQGPGDDEGPDNGSKGEEPEGEKPEGNTPVQEQPEQPDSEKNPQAGPQGTSPGSTNGAGTIGRSAATPASRPASGTALPRTADASVAGAALCAACGLVAVLIWTKGEYPFWSRIPPH
jgi:hypothetical protein